MEPYVTPDTLSTRCRAWLDRIAAHNVHRMQLHPERAALLVIDMQRFFVDPAGPAFLPAAQAVLPTVRDLVAAFRRAARPVLFTRHVHHADRIDAGIMGWWWEEMCVEGTPESETHPDLAPLPREKVILKHRYSAFYNTDLETVLRGLQVEDLVISGVMTNLCCESTARDAYYRDFRVFFLADGTATGTEEMHLASLLNLAYGFAWVTTGEAVVAELQESRPHA